MRRFLFCTDLWTTDELFRPEVKRIIILASCATVMRESVEPIVLNESDWNNEAIEMCQKLGRNALPAKKYQASKTLAEKGMEATLWIYQVDVMQPRGLFIVSMRRT